MGTTLNVQVILRNDTASNWETKNPTLGKGEAGIEVDTRKIKYGDGVTAWNSLDYGGLTEEEVQALLDNYMLVSTYASATSGVVKQADKVTNSLSINGKTYNGSATVSITADDIAALLPADLVKQTDYGTTSVGGTIKSGSTANVGQVVISSAGIGSVSKVADASSADKVANKITFSKASGANQDIAFDGSAAVTIPIATVAAAGLVRSASGTINNSVIFSTTGVGTVPVLDASTIAGDIPSTVTSGGAAIATQPYVTAQINNKLADLSTAMVFKGSVGSGGTVTSLPSTDVNVGDTYVVKVAGTYAGEKCEAGDLIIAVASTPEWTIIQTNIEGAVRTNEAIVASDANKLVIWNADGTVGKSVAVGTVLTQSSSFGGDVNGTYNNLTLGTQVVEASNIANGTITDAQMAAASLSTDKLFIPTGSKLILNGGGA